MGIIFMDGVEKNSLDQWTAVSGVHVESSSGLDMSGSYVLHVPGIYQYIKKQFNTSETEIYMTFRYRLSDTSCNKVLEFLDSSGTLIALITRNTTTSLLKIYRGTDDSGTLLCTGTKTIVAGTTYLIKIHYKPSNSAGVFDVYIDDFNTPDLTSSSSDTTSNLENVQAFVFGHTAGSYATAAAYYDDIVVSTTDITQNLRIAGKAVTGAGTTTQWDPSTGANYECIDEVPPVHTDYNFTNTADEIDTFAVANCTEIIASVAAVQVELSCRYVGTPTTTHIQHVVRSGGTNYASGVDKDPPTSFGVPAIHIWETDPDTDAAWDETGLNAIEIGYKATA